MVAVPSILAASGNQYSGPNGSQGNAGLFSEIFMAAQNVNTGRQNQYTPQSQSTFNYQSSTNSGIPTLGSYQQTSTSNPLLSFFQHLREQNLEDESLVLNPQNQAQLEELLLNSGYNSQQIDELLQAARQEDGSINLLALGQTVLMYPPTGGQAFSLSQTDRPIFAKAMQDLGIASADIENYLNSATRQGNDYLLRDVASLLAQSRIDPVVGEQGMVDQADLKTLLQQLGLSQEETDALLNNTSGQGANAREMFALLQAAANKQDQGITQALQDLAQRSQQSQQENATDAQRLQAHMIQTLQKMEAKVDKQADASQLAQGKEQMAEATPQTDGKLAESVKAVLESAARVQNSEPQNGRNQEQGKGSPQQQEQADQTRLVEQAAKDAVVQNKTSGQENALSAVLGVNSAASAKAAGGTVNVLPAYLVRQVAFNMAQMASRGQDSLRLELKPPSLGELSIELTVKDGAIKASMVAQTVAAKKALEAGMEQLKQQLAQQGLRLESIEISVHPDAQRRHEQADPNSGQKNSQRRQVSETAAGDDEENPGRVASQLSVMA